MGLNWTWSSGLKLTKSGFELVYVACWDFGISQANMKLDDRFGLSQDGLDA